MITLGEGRRKKAQPFDFAPHLYFLSILAKEKLLFVAKHLDLGTLSLCVPPVFTKSDSQQV